MFSCYLININIIHILNVYAISYVGIDVVTFGYAPSALVCQNDFTSVDEIYVNSIPIFCKLDTNYV